MCIRDRDYTTRAENLKKTMNEKLITEDGVYCDGLMSDGTQSTLSLIHISTKSKRAGACAGRIKNRFGFH